MLFYLTKNKGFTSSKKPINIFLGRIHQHEYDRPICLESVSESENKELPVAATDRNDAKFGTLHVTGLYFQPV